MTKTDKANRMCADVDGLEDFTVEVIEKGRRAGTIDVVLEKTEATLTFETLDKIATLFQSKKINVEAGERQGGYCETCAYTESYAKVTIYEAVV